MSLKASFPGNDQGRYGEIGVFEDSSHRVRCEKVHAAKKIMGFSSTVPNTKQD